jgi:hypothetical protein
MRRLLSFGCASIFLAATVMYASVFGTIRVIVHDPAHRPLPNAQVVLKNASSSLSLNADTDSAGIAQFMSVPIGEYEVQIAEPGFAPASGSVRALSDRIQDLHVQLSLASVQQSVEVSADAIAVDTSSSTPQTTITREQIVTTPGADGINSLSFITDYVPGAYIVHDQLHVRGGHQVTWAIDGVPVPNTNIASNVGPQFDPKDVDYVEAQRGNYMADFGDRTYGVFDVVPKSGFERNRMAQLTASYGSYHQTDDQLSFGDHTERFAYYASVSGYRNDHGLEPPTFANLHNQSSGGGVFSSLTYNAHNGDQLRFVGSARGDFYQVPNDPEQQAAGVRGREREQDAFSSFTYLHPISTDSVLTITPFFHFNRAAFEGGPLDVPSATENRASTYYGGQASWSYVRGRNNAKIGIYAFGQHDNTFFSLLANDGSGDSLSQREKLNGDLEAIFLEDQFRATRWLTFNAGVRLTRFSGAVTETAPSPRLGIAATLPKLTWTLRGAYSRYYQAPPLSTVTGPLLDLAASQGFTFLPLHGERDTQVDLGVTIPIKRWEADVDVFQNHAHNFFDHDALGNSNIFFPLTIERARVRGLEVSIRSPRVLKHANVYLTYSHQKAQGAGAVTGGFTDFTSPKEGYFFLDHDQRDTLSTGFTSDLPRRVWLSGNLSYGSGFLDGDGPQHLPPHHSVDLSLGRPLGEHLAAKLTATNIGNSHYYIDQSNTFGGSHVSDPRMVMLQITWRFHY